MQIDLRRIELIDAATVALLKTMSPSQKWEMANRMVIEAREAISYMLKRQHPNWDHVRLSEEVVRRMSHR